MIIEIPKKRLDKTDEIALHHGFQFSRVPATKTDRDSFLSPKEKELIIRGFKSKMRSSEPLLVYHDEPILINEKQVLNQKTHKILNLDIVGIPEGIAEAMIINTSFKILEEEGYKNNLIDINCTGDKDSISKFTNELLNYYRKNSISLDDESKKLLNKKDIAILHCHKGECVSIQKNAPRPINFLSEQSQRHFKEVLEYLEEMNIPYRINDQLISDENHYSKIIFEIKNESKNGELLLARGGRYDEIANKITNKRSLVAVGVSMQFKKGKTIKAYSNTISQPKIFLIQFGFKAKLISFEVIEILRQHHITVHQNLHKNKLSEQFDVAKKMKIPYIITIGQKEALDREIIFKNNIDASTHIIKLKKLPQFLRKVRIV
ncbi:ATP phosphoribosyltransferase regulatory subunit [Patescibacteria group bacterium]|nr:ATP phosphoribosyltransferase regulatory subunit [Patescibacteria group bacterium]